MAKELDTLHTTYRSVEYTRSMEPRYVAEIRHRGLQTYRVLRDKDEWILDQKIEAQFSKWNDQWEKHVVKNNAQATKAANQSLAEERATEAKERLAEVENILLYTLGIDDTIEWDTLKDKKKFNVRSPQFQLAQQLKNISIPLKVVYKKKNEAPEAHDFQPKLSFLDKIIKSKGQKKADLAKLNFEAALDAWKKHSQECDEYNRKMDDEYERKLKIAKKEKEDAEARIAKLVSEWELQKDAYYKDQELSNAKIDEMKALYFKSDADAVVEYCELVLNNSQYPDTFPKNFDLEYNDSNKILIIEYVLPNPDQLPRIADVKYIAAKREIKENYISETQLSKMYDTTIYNICLRTIHEIFEADKAEAVDMVVFNGWVEAINKATGKKDNSCIVSIQTRKSEFLEVDLAHIDPKVCFKSLKGVGSSKLSGMTPIQPLLQVSKSDNRFVSSYEVADKLHEGYNLASMDWEDFEHLLRELFEREFSSNGGEVKVTRASRDGGVDAVAFDPDPIRGGKIVIQAKRYTNTVGVSSVRDLYGTVMNEGATKGILVTTADYGPDAYEFAKNKPITLLNGNNLLFLLEKHGQKARIDLAEAKRLATK
ncbi:restriction endonuclease [Niabella sp.]|uniref:restriction endonuclease n=1 Tax=Niabella sp. TaxID=1962976 RepID=UPI002618D815|nr:restriction endonuclease [Niabella sp.]